jgi:gliding motility-associated-like protein
MSLLFLGLFSQAQLVVDTAMDPNQMVQNLVGNGVTITNVQVTAAPNSYGYYTSTATSLGTNQGLLLTTGRAVNAIGPNNSSGLPQLSGPPSFSCLNCALYENGTPGDSLLNLAQNRITYDACRVEFDIIPQGDSLSFSYTFASEEYLEWVGSIYNDVFGFYISGPNIGSDVNIALIPNTSQSVAINNVNHLQNTQYFYNNTNPFGQSIQYDGFTRNLVAKVGNLVPCQTYHLILTIADGSDRKYDSGVFVNKIESNPVVVVTSTAGGLDYMIEGCNSGTITFSRPEATASAQSVVYWVGGTATNGTDYTQIGNGIPLSLNSIIIPANQTSASINIDAFADLVEEGEEYLTIYLDNPTCSNLQVLDSVNFYIRDFLTVDIQPDVAGVCFGGCTQLTADIVQTDVSSFDWSPTVGLSDPTSTSPDACPTTNTTYTITSRVAQCIVTDSVYISVSNIDVTLDASNSTCSGGNNGSVTASVNGATEPVTYSWTGPDGFTSTEQNPDSLAAGEYCVTAVDANGCIAEGCVTVVEAEILQITNTGTSDFGCTQISCFGACDGTATVSVSGGIAPYSYSWDNGGTASSVSNLCAGTYTVTVSDAAGCELTEDFVLAEPEQVTIELVGSIDVLCNGSSTGEITVDAAGGCSPYTYTWSHNSNLNSPIAQNLESGDYSVSVRDANNCQSAGSLLITVNPPINPLVLTLDNKSNYDPFGYGVSCPDATDGWILATAASGTEPYVYNWQLVSTGATVGTSEDIADITCGVYRLTVTDANGCEESIVTTLDCVPALNATFTSAPNPCDDPNAGTGSINVTTTTGGNGGPYGYAYDGPNCSPCLVEDLLNVASGDYVLTVSDVSGCSKSYTINVGANDGFIADGVVTPPSCVNGVGSINVSVEPAGTYYYMWTDAFGSFIGNSQDISSLPPGDYSVEINSSGDFGGPVMITMPVDPSTTITVGYDGAHTYMSDLRFILQGPPSCGSPIVFLSEHTGATNTVCNGGNDFTSLFFTTTPADDLARCTAPTPFTGTYSSYSGTPIDWTPIYGCNVASEGWSVQVWDCTSGDFGTLTNATVNFIGTDSNGQPQNITYSSGSISAAIGVTSCSSALAANFTIPADQVPNLGTVGGGTGTTCSSTLNFTIPNAEPVVPYLVESVDPICFGQNNGSINIETTGGTGPYTYSWSPSGLFLGSTSEDLNNLFAGTYNVTATDVNGCTGQLSITLDVQQTLDITIQVSQYNGGYNISCNGANDGQITVNVSGGTPDCTTFAPDCYQYDWVGLSGSESQCVSGSNSAFCGLTPGSYTVNVTDANGCLATTTTDLTEPPIITDLSSTTDVTCFGADNGTITTAIDGGSGVYVDFDWTPSVAPNDPSATTLTDLAPGCYTLVVTDNNQCTQSFEYCIAEPEQVQISAEITPIDCATQSGAFATFTVTGGTGILTVETTGPNGPFAGTNIGPLEAGSYTTTVTDENGCEATYSFDIATPESFSLSFTPIIQDPGQVYQLKCFGDDNGAIDVFANGGTAPFTYNWVDAGGNSIGAESIVSGLTAGEYCVTVTDVNGCFADSCYTITQPETPLSIASTISLYPGGYNISCFGACDGAITAEVTGGVPGYTYLWNDGNGLDANPIQTSLCARIFNLLITDANGCDTLLIYELTEPSPIVIDPTLSLFDGGFNVSCNGSCNGTIDLSVIGSEGPYSIEWTNPVLADGESQINLCAGDYEIKVTDSLGCIKEATYSITEPEVLEVNATAEYSCVDINSELCATVTGGSGSYTYVWDNQGSTACTTVTSSGSYCVNVTDSNGCTDQACVQTTVYPAIDTEATPINTTCGNNNGAINLNVSGGSNGFNYSWSGPGSNTTSQNQSDLPGGSYNVLITDATTGCQTNLNVNVSTSVQPTVTETITDVNCNGEATGVIAVVVSNATPSVNYSWTDSNNNVVGTTDILSAVAAGIYNLVWSDGAGCGSTVEYTITEAAALTLSAQVSFYENNHNVSSFGATDGAIDLTVGGGTPAYTFDWNQIVGDDNDSDIANLAAGQYSVIVTDANGCSIDSTFTLTEPSTIILYNGLTPNGDGFNDVYEIAGLGGKLKGDFKVFNRWGNEVYSNSNYVKEWYGQNNSGELLPNGTYYVVLNVNNQEFSTYVDLRK